MNKNTLLRDCLSSLSPFHRSLQANCVPLRGPHPQPPSTYTNDSPLQRGLPLICLQILLRYNTAPFPHLLANTSSCPAFQILNESLKERICCPQKPNVKLLQPETHPWHSVWVQSHRPRSIMEGREKSDHIKSTVCLIDHPLFQK